ncbi:Pectinesterase/pectinesterase inhibitor PPE8B [Linum grandiflorum]
MLTTSFGLGQNRHSLFPLPIQWSLSLPLPPTHRLFNSFTCPLLSFIYPPSHFIPSSNSNSFHPHLSFLCFPPSLKKNRAMQKQSTSSFLPVLLLTVIILPSVSAATGQSAATYSRNRGGGSTSEYYQNQCLRVPTSQFLSSLESVLEIIGGVNSIISNFGGGGGFFGGSRLTSAISDCLDLLDLSADVLSWSISASKSPKGKNNSTGDLSHDLRTWLSAAMAHPDTCIEGFEGTNSILKSLVAGGLSDITSSVQQLLTDVDSKSPRSTSNDHFPSWVQRQDRKLLQQVIVNGLTVDAVVAKDGSGNFTSIMDAVAAAPEYSMKRFVVYIKAGVYQEYVEIKKKKWNVMMIGDGINRTVITGNRNFVDGWTTFRTATFAVSGRGFIARDITIENSSGPEKHQAVALRSDSDLSVYYRVEVRGYQDTLYTHTMRQFYRDSVIKGTVDFIFGNAAAVFQNCSLLARKGLDNQKNTITAHGKKDPNQSTGYSIQFCNIGADSDLAPFGNLSYTYLGRPWKNFSTTVVMQSYIGEAVRPEGWLEWNGPMFLDTIYYGEFMNYGPGSGMGRRVKWPGYHALNSSSAAANFTVGQFIEGNLWLPSTGVRYSAGFQQV